MCCLCRSTEGTMWLKLLLVLVLQGCKVNLLPFEYDGGEEDQNWSRFENTFMEDNDEQMPSFKLAGTPCPPHNLPQSQRISASDVKKPFFKPSRNTRPMPDVLKSMLLPLPKKPTAISTNPIEASKIEVLCHLDRIYVRVLKSLFINPDAGSYLKEGTCYVNQVTATHYYFLYPLNSCGVTRQEDEDRVTYSNTLVYEPVEDGVIAREMPFSVNLECRYNRHHRSYSVGFRPEVGGGTLFLSLNAGVSLTPVDEHWRPLAEWQSFVIGQPMYFLAKAPHTHKGKKVYLSKCYITASQAPDSTQSYTVLDNYGCMVDGKNTPQSKFYPSKPGTVKFSVGAVIFKDMISQAAERKFILKNESEGILVTLRKENTQPISETMFIHCEMSLGPMNPTPSTKSCSYSADTNQWSELSGNDSVCACCDAVCPAPEPEVTSRMVTSNAWEVETEDEKPALRRFEPEEADLDHSEFDQFWDTEEDWSV